jgi:hypothetical protein
LAPAGQVLLLQLVQLTLPKLLAQLVQQEQQVPALRAAPRRHQPLVFLLLLQPLQMRHLVSKCQIQACRLTLQVLLHLALVLPLGR